MRLTKKLSLGLLFGIISSPAFASYLVLDNSPATINTKVYEDTYTNIYGWQYFAAKFQFDDTAILNGMDIYSNSYFGHIGDAAIITVWADRDGLPATILSQKSTTISAIDENGAVGIGNRKHADFEDFTAEAGTTYWISMAGDGGDVGLGQATLSASGNDSISIFHAQGFDSLFYGRTQTQTMAYNLYALNRATRTILKPEFVEPPITVPEPHVAGLFGLGLLVLAVRRRVGKP